MLVGATTCTSIPSSDITSAKFFRKAPLSGVDGVGKAGAMQVMDGRFISLLRSRWFLGVPEGATPAKSERHSHLTEQDEKTMVDGVVRIRSGDPL